MPSLTGGSQLDPEYAPWAKSKLNKREREAVEKIKIKEKEVNDLVERINILQTQKDKLLKEISGLQKKCRHQNVTSRTGAYDISYGVCVDCGKNV